MTSILITGIKGFIGAKYADYARARGWNIIGFDQGEAGIFGKCDHYFELDLGSARASDLALAIPAVDYILHAGGISGFMVATDQPQHIVNVNVAGAAAVLEFARRSRCRRLVLCSSIMAYGPDAAADAVRSETEYPRPVTVYGASKAAMEDLMHGFVGQCGLDAVALRFSHVYGPGRTTECFIREMLAAAAAECPCRIPQSGRSLRQYVHIDDVCRAIDLAMDVDDPTERVFNISGGEIHTLTQTAEAVRAEMGALDATFDESRDLPAYRIGRLSIERARAVLGYEPQLTLAKGLSRYRQSSFAGPKP